MQKKAKTKEILFFQLLIIIIVKKIIFGITVYKWITKQESDKLHPNPPIEKVEEDKMMKKIYTDYYPDQEEQNKNLLDLIARARMLTAWFRLTSADFNQSHYLELVGMDSYHNFRNFFKFKMFLLLKLKRAFEETLKRYEANNRQVE